MSVQVTQRQRASDHRELRRHNPSQRPLRLLTGAFLPAVLVAVLTLLGLGTPVSGSTPETHSNSDPLEASFTNTYVPSEVPAPLKLISADGQYVAAVWIRTSAEQTELRVVSSSDGGATLSPPMTLGIGSGAVFPSQIKVVDASVIVLWLAEKPSGGSDLFLARSSDGGATYSSPVNVSGSPDTVSNLFGSMLVNGSNVTVFWGEDDGYDEIYAASSFNGGLTPPLWCRAHARDACLTNLRPCVTPVAP